MLSYSSTGGRSVDGKYQNGAIPEGRGWRSTGIWRGAKTDRGVCLPIEDYLQTCGQKHGLDPFRCRMAFARQRPSLAFGDLGARRRLDQLRSLFWGHRLCILMDEVMADLDAPQSPSDAF